MVILKIKYYIHIYLICRLKKFCIETFHFTFLDILLTKMYTYIYVYSQKVSNKQLRIKKKYINEKYKLIIN